MTLAVSWVFMVGLDKYPVDTGSSHSSGLASRLKESMNDHHGTGLKYRSNTASFFLYLNRFITSYRISKLICSLIPFKRSRKIKTNAS